LTADFVVLDDLLARRKAQRLGLQVIGTIGLLLWMEKKQLLDAGQTWQKLQQLTEHHGMYLLPSLREQLKTQLLGSH
jgi:predicted nucleic acid-binding protein